MFGLDTIRKLNETAAVNYSAGNKRQTEAGTSKREDDIGHSYTKDEAQYGHDRSSELFVI